LGDAAGEGEDRIKQQFLDSVRVLDVFDHAEAQMRLLPRRRGP
jgi:hypothetical protein